MPKKHFKNFDGLRFLAALFVVVNHTESIRDFFHLPSLHTNPFFRESGSLAVKFFFVLSGFLITYLLLAEKEEKENAGGNISLANFYRKRILRIWPLYYFLILLVFLLLPFFSFFHYDSYDSQFLNAHKEDFLLCLSFLPNLSMFLHGNILYLGQLWSLSVEEFFYLFFPLLIYVFRRKNIAIAIAGCLFIYFITVAYLQYKIAATPSLQYSFLDIWLRLYQVYIFLFGSLAAIAFRRFYNHSFVLHNRTMMIVFAWSLLLITFLSLLLSSLLPSGLLKTLYYPLLFMLLLFFLSVSDVGISGLNNKVLVYLGKLSFGVYMLHPLAVTMCVKWMGEASISRNIYANTFVFDVAAICLTIIMAAITYQYIERPFLRLRKVS